MVVLQDGGRGKQNSHENSTTAMRVFPVTFVDSYIISDVSLASHRICTPSPNVVLQAFDLLDIDTRSDAITEYMLLLFGITPRDIFEIERFFDKLVNFMLIKITSYTITLIIVFDVSDQIISVVEEYILFKYDKLNR